MKVEITGRDDLLGLADDDAVVCGPDGCAVPA